jgi:hypothetical protein
MRRIPPTVRNGLLMGAVFLLAWIVAAAAH